MKTSTTDRTWTIDKIQENTERKAQDMALETLRIKDHDVYLVDLGGSFGYSALVFYGGMHTYYANDYALHHPGMDRGALRKLYIESLNNKLFTDDEIGAPLADYAEYMRRSDYLHNIYGQRAEHVSIFGIFRTEHDRESQRARTAGKVYDPVSFGYYDDKEFVKHHIALAEALARAFDNAQKDYAYMKAAFLHEMFNHEYGLDPDGDYDTLSAFGDLDYAGDDGAAQESYFDQLGFSREQRRAYRDAIREYFATCGDL